MSDLNLQRIIKEKNSELKNFIVKSFENSKDFVKENPILGIAISAILVMLSIPLLPILAVISIVSIITISILLIFIVIVITFIVSRFIGLIFKTLMLFVPITEISIKLFIYFSFFYLISKTYKATTHVTNETNEPIPKYKIIIDGFAESLSDYITLVCNLYRNVKAFIKSNFKKENLSNIKKSLSSTFEDLKVYDSTEKKSESVDNHGEKSQEIFSVSSSSSSSIEEPKEDKTKKDE